MKRILAGLSAAVIAIPVILLGAGVAAADDGKVIVYSHELAPLSVYPDATDCEKLPVDAHVLVNLTEHPVKTYSDPGCLFPTLTVQPDHGAHVMPGTGAFRAG